VKISGYTISSRIGAGGQAMVYVAIQESLQRPVALKVLNPVHADSPEFTTRFLNEGRILASLGHSNVITIYDIGVDGGFHYISMELVEGGDLKRRMREGMDSNRVLDYVATIADSLAAAHDKNIVHRDIKPANVLFRKDGTLLLTDFGIAKQLDAKNELTLTGTTVGSPHYLSPEQAQGRSVDGRADIYSLGIMAFEMLTGSKPYEGESDIDTIFKHINDPIPKLPTEHALLQELIERMIAKTPGDRFESAHEVVEYIAEMESMEPVPTGRLKDYEFRSEYSDEIATETKTPIAPHVAAEIRANADTIPAGLTPADAETEVNPRSRRARIAELMVPVAATGVVMIALAGSWLLFLKPPPPGPNISRLAETRPGPDISRLAETRPGPDMARVEPEPEPLPPTPPPPPQRSALDTPVAEVSSAARVEVLLGAADQALRDYRLTKPNRDNALEYYNAVLAIDPGNPVAADGHRLIAERYGMLAQGEMHRGNLIKAGIYVDRGLSVHPSDQQLLSLRQQVEGEIAKRQASGGTRPITTDRSQPRAGAGDAASEPNFTGESPLELFRRIRDWFSRRDAPKNGR
jgi:serine/threonine-protein kinase PpkA